MTGKKIKVALCLSGEPRSSMASFPYIYETFLQKNSFYKTDVFIHTFKGFRAMDLYNPKTVHLPRFSENEIFFDWLSQEAKFTKNIANKLNKNFVGTNLNSSTLKNLVLMFLGIHSCFQLVPLSKYDIFIRCRFDIFFNNKFYIENIIKDILGKQYDFFTPLSSPYLPLEDNNTIDEINDQLSIGNIKSTIHYQKLFFNLSNLINKTKSLRAEKILKKHMDKGDIKLNQSFISQHIIRQTSTNLHPPINNFLDQ